MGMLGDFFSLVNTLYILLLLIIFLCVFFSLTSFIFYFARPIIYLFLKLNPHITH